jgi:hypothetical protein
MLCVRDFLRKTENKAHKTGSRNSGKAVRDDQ